LLHCFRHSDRYLLLHFHLTLVSHARYYIVPASLDLWSTFTAANFI
jgi:hypothetical protein